MSTKNDKNLSIIRQSFAHTILSHKVQELASKDKKKRSIAIKNNKYNPCIISTYDTIYANATSFTIHIRRQPILHSNNNNNNPHNIFNNPTILQIRRKIYRT